MKIEKSMLKTLWYEDGYGNEIPCDENYAQPEEAAFRVSRFPLEVRTTHLRLIKQEDVDKCKHRHKWIKRTGGWVKGIKGRVCQACHGTQTRKWWQPWGRKWEGYGSYEVFTGSCHIGGGNEAVVLAMANSGDYTLGEAILAYSMACERCANVLAYKYTDGKEGYVEHSEEWEKCGTHCQFCKGERPKCP
jgi:hypothetical protein